MAAGYAWRFFNPGGLDRHRVRHTLSVTVLYFFMPALAFGLLATTSIDRSFFLVPLVAILAAVLCTATGFVGQARCLWGQRDLSALAELEVEADGCRNSEIRNMGRRRNHLPRTSCL
jgi:predicted permease